MVASLSVSSQQACTPNGTRAGRCRRRLRPSSRHRCTSTARCRPSGGQADSRSPRRSRPPSGRTASRRRASRRSRSSRPRGGWQKVVLEHPLAHVAVGFLVQQVGVSAGTADEIQIEARPLVAVVEKVRASVTEPEADPAPGSGARVVPPGCGSAGWLDRSRTRGVEHDPGAAAGLVVLFPRVHHVPDLAAAWKS